MHCGIHFVHFNPTMHQICNILLSRINLMVLHCLLWESFAKPSIWIVGFTYYGGVLSNLSHRVRAVASLSPPGGKIRSGSAGLGRVDRNSGNAIFCVYFLEQNCDSKLSLI